MSDNPQDPTPFDADTDLPRVVQVGHPVLRAGTTDIARDSFSVLTEVIDVMTRTMREAPGVGLAAPQIGLALRIVVIEDRAEDIDMMPPEEVVELEREPVALHVLINPTYRGKGERTVTAFEGCLSLTGYRALVARHHTVVAEWTDVRGARRKQEFSGWPARIVQHEIDHLNGVLYIDRMESRSFSDAPEWREYWMNTPVDAALQKLGITSTDPTVR
jgi:peptide deformylase